MKGKMWLKQGLALALAAGVLAGCGSAKTESAFNGANSKSYIQSDDFYTAASEAAGEAAYEPEEAYDYETYEDVELADADYDDMGKGGDETPEVADENRKLIRSVTLEAETNNFDELNVNVTNRVKALGGYIESSNVYTSNSYYSSNQLRTADYTLRIPAKKTDEFLSMIGEQSNVTRQSESVTDVTLDYVDMESHKKALKKEEQQLMELMDEADDLEDLITIQDRLTYVRYQIESMESQLRSYDNKVDYSTVYLTAKEVEEYTPVETPSRWQTMTEGFMDRLQAVAYGFLDFLIWIVVHLPDLLVWAVIIFCIVKFFRWWWDSKPERKEKRLAKHAAKKAKKEAKKQKQQSVQQPPQGPQGPQQGPQQQQQPQPKQQQPAQPQQQPQQGNGNSL